MSDLFNPSSKWFYPLRILILFLLGLAIYHQTFAFGFVFDDNLFIVHNIYIGNIKNLHFLWDHFPKTRLIGEYSFAFNYHLNYLDPRGYHIFNFIVHLITSYLVWALTRVLFRMSGWLSINDSLREELAFIIALLFLVHPGQTQAVTYISQRFESIATMFYLCTVFFYINGRISSVSTHKFLFFAAAILCGFLGILSKETTATIPFMIIAIELIFLNRDPLSFKRFLSWRFFLPIIVLSGIFFFLFMKLLNGNFNTYLHFSRPSGSHDGDIITCGKYLLTQMRVFLTFLRLLIFPVNQNLDYDYPLSTGLLSPPLTLVGLCSIGFMAFLIVKLRQHWPLISFGLAWVLITFSINTAPRVDVIFEHKLYLISFGFFLAAVCSLASILKDRKFLFILLVTIVAVFSLASYKRNHVWQNELTLWEDVIKKSPHKARAYFNLGEAYLEVGRFNEALIDFNKYISVYPNSPEPYIDKGIIYQKEGKSTRALIEFTKAMIILPGYVLPYYDRGREYERMGNFTRAISDFTTIIEIDSLQAEAYYLLGNIYVMQGKLPQAISEFNRAIDVNPNYKEAYNNRAYAYSLLKKQDFSPHQ